MPSHRKHKQRKGATQAAHKRACSGEKYWAITDDFAATAPILEAEIEIIMTYLKDDIEALAAKWFDALGAPKNGETP